MIHTILVEDDPFTQNYFSRMLDSDEKIHLVTAVRDAFEAEKLCTKETDLVLMDVQTLHRHSGLAAGKRIKEKHPHIKVIIMTSLVDPGILASAKQGCADSLWYKDHGTKGIIEIIERTMAGEHVFPDAAPPVELEGALSDVFSPAQIEILRCYIRGMSYAEIGKKFHMSKDGVNWNMREMVRRGGFESKEDLIAMAIDSKLIVTTLKEE